MGYEVVTPNREKSEVQRHQGRLMEVKERISRDTVARNTVDDL